MIGQETLFISLPFIGVVTIVAGVAMLIGANQDGKEQQSKNDSVRHVYLYLASFATLLVASAAIATLLGIGVESFGTSTQRQSPPPSLYLISDDPKPLAPTETGTAEVTCTDNACSLSETQRARVTEWTAEYRNWKNNTEHSTNQAQGVVAGLSFLIIGGLVYLFHWRLAQRERTRKDGEPLMVRTIYLWAMSFVMLVVVVVSGGFVVNSVLKQVIPGAQDTTQNIFSTPSPVDTTLMEQVATCGDTCDLDSETVSYAQAWETDYHAWSEKQNTRSLADELAVTLPYLIVAIPLFWYHFRTVRHESKKETTPTSTI